MRTALIFALILVVSVVVASAEDIGSKQTKVVMETSKGKIILELFPSKAPLSVENFLGYVKSGFFDGTIFHRVIPRFMIQGGGFTPDMKRKPTRAPINNEADNGLGNNRGTIAMARTRDPHSATSQFFINIIDNNYLNHRSKDLRGWGYAVFGKVIEGMDVVDAISRVKTGTLDGFRDVPVDPVMIHKASVAKEKRTGSSKK